MWLSATYAVLFGTWLLLTVVWQFEPLRHRSRLLRRVAELHVLPIWTFFAPRPGMSDTHLLVRDRLKDGSFTDWREVSLIEERRATHWLWNPRKRLDKLAVDAVSDIKTIKIRSDQMKLPDEQLQNHVKLSKGYLVLANIGFAQPKLSGESVSRQLAVVETRHVGGTRSVHPLFFSAVHAFASGR